MNGRGKPVGGTAPVTTAMFRTTWTVRIVAMPMASRQPKRSFACIAIFRQYIITAIKAAITNKHPINPNSSPIMLNMKSLSENGRKEYFWRELNNPTPNQPPEPKE